MLRPSVDLGAIAGDVARAGRFKGQGGGTGIRLLRKLASSSEADLLSYILFDGNYAAELVRIGWEDARARHHDLCSFLRDCVVPAE
jgi:NTE family protein